MNNGLERYNHLKYHSGPQSEIEKDDFVDFLYQYSELTVPEVDETIAWNGFARRLANSKKNQRLVWLKLAASVIVVLSVALGTYLATMTTKPIQLAALDQVESVTFSDGSLSVLNQNSLLTYPESFGSERRVSLEGEAYFDIQKSNKPFIIDVNGVEVKVLGTAFNLATTDESVRLYVERGLVAFSNDGIETKITAGTEAVFFKKTNQVEIKESPSANIMSWRNGNFKFNNTPLKEAVKDLKEFYGVDFRLSNKKLASCRISASFNNKSLKEVLSLLESILDVKTKLKDQTVKISGKGC